MLDKAGRDFAETGKPKSQTAPTAKEEERQPLFLRVPKTMILRLKRMSADLQAEGREDWRMHEIVTGAVNAVLDAHEKKGEAR
jgi:hypothetical protein